MSFRKSVISTLVLFVLTPLSGAAAPTDFVDECLEGGVEASSLPDSVPAQLVVTPCEGCEPILLQIDQGTRFFVGNDVVALSVLRKYSKLESSQTRVCHDMKGHATRIVVIGSLVASDRTE
jgi:hypothetical protein